MLLPPEMPIESASMVTFPSRPCVERGAGLDHSLIRQTTALACTTRSPRRALPKVLAIMLLSGPERESESAIFPPQSLHRDRAAHCSGIGAVGVTSDARTTSHA